MAQVEIKGKGQKHFCKLPRTRKSFFKNIQEMVPLLNRWHKINRQETTEILLSYFVSALEREYLQTGKCRTNTVRL